MTESDAEAEGSKELDDLFERFGIDDDWALGFFAGVVTGPEDVTPAEWLPAFMGDNELDEAEAHTAAAALAQLHAAVGVELRTDPNGLCPEADDEDGITSFCGGYIRGAATHTTWMQNERGLALLVILTALAGELPEGEHLDEAELAGHRKKLGAYLGELFTMFETPRVPFVAAPKVNRNDACPCGSGKKYKKCCLS